MNLEPEWKVNRFEVQDWKHWPEAPLFDDGGRAPWCAGDEDAGFLIAGTANYLRVELEPEGEDSEEWSIWQYYFERRPRSRMVQLMMVLLVASIPKTRKEFVTLLEAMEFEQIR